MLRNNTIFMQNRILYKFLFFGKIDEHDTCIIMLLLTERNVAANCDAMKRTQTVLFWWRYMRYGKERWMCMVQCAVCKMPLREMIWEFVCHSRICRWAGETVALGRHIYILWRRRHWTIYTVIWHTIRKSSCFWPICIIFNLRLHLNSTFEFIYIFYFFRYLHMTLSVIESSSAELGRRGLDPSHFSMVPSSSGDGKNVNVDVTVRFDTMWTVCKFIIQKMNMKKNEIHKEFAFTYWNGMRNEKTNINSHALILIMECNIRIVEFDIQSMTGTWAADSAT